MKFCLHHKHRVKRVCHWTRLARYGGLQVYIVFCAASSGHVDVTWCRDCEGGFADRTQMHRLGCTTCGRLEHNAHVAQCRMHNPPNPTTAGQLSLGWVDCACDSDVLQLLDLRPSCSVCSSHWHRHFSNCLCRLQAFPDRRLKSYHIVSYRIVSYRIVSYRIVSYHIISYHIIFIWLTQQYVSI